MGEGFGVMSKRESVEGLWKGRGGVKGGCEYWWWWRTTTKRKRKRRDEGGGEGMKE